MAKTNFSDTPPQGTIVTAAFLNAVNYHRHTGRDVDGDGALDYAVTTGSANAYVLTLPKPLTAHIIGMPITFKANFTNTGAASLNINDLGAVSIKKNIDVDLAAADILANQLVVVRWDGVNYQLQNPNRANIKIGRFTRDMAAVSGSASYTGIGFRPSCVIFFGQIATAGLCMGIDDAINHYCIIPYNHGDLQLYEHDASHSISLNEMINKAQRGKITALNADGFTLTWERVGPPVSATAIILYMAFR